MPEQFADGGLFVWCFTGHCRLSWIECRGYGGLPRDRARRCTGSRNHTANRRPEDGSGRNDQRRRTARRHIGSFVAEERKPSLSWMPFALVAPVAVAGE